MTGYAAVAGATPDAWSISGSVLNNEDGAPVANLKLELRRHKRSWFWDFPGYPGTFHRFQTATTDSEGKFTFTGSESGNFALQAACPDGTPGIPLFEHIGRVESGRVTLNVLFKSEICADRR